MHSWNTSLITSENASTLQLHDNTNQVVIGQYTKWQCIYEHVLATSSLLLEIISNNAVTPNILLSISSNSNISDMDIQQQQQQLQDDEESLRIDAMLGQVLEGKEELDLNPWRTHSELTTHRTCTTTNTANTNTANSTTDEVLIWRGVLQVLLTQLHTRVQNQEVCIRDLLSGVEVEHGLPRKHCPIMHTGIACLCWYVCVGMCVLVCVC